MGNVRGDMGDMVRGRVHLCAVAAYVLVAVTFTWPLVLNLGTTLTGPPSGDTGAYVWNQWVFQHELLDHRSFPYFTDRLFASSRRANLSLHNYTTFQNVLALPLVRVLGVVTTFNIVYLLMTVITAYCMFLLALDLVGAAGIAWLSGLLFAWNPFMVTRGMGHFSLVAAAPLPILLLVMRRAARRERLADGFALGAVVWWAASTDVYYAVYAVLIAAMFVAGRVVGLERHQVSTRHSIKWGLDTLILVAAALVVSILVSGGWQLTFLGRPLRIRTLYTPVLILTALVLLRVAWEFRPSMTSLDRRQTWRVLRLATISAVVAAALMSPVLYAFGQRLVEGDFNPPRIFWRNSPPGIDLLALILPNPNHPLAPAAIGEWLTSRPNGYLENVGSIPLVAIVVIAIAFARRWRPTRCAALLCTSFVLLALGPFIHVAGINTAVPGPWTLLRYVPIIGLARTPARFVAVVMLMTAVLFAAALASLAARSPHRRRLVGITGMLLVFELLPAPHALSSAVVPSIYRHVAAAPDNVTVLELPFGVRDGTSSIGNFSSQSQFFQTAHGKALLGGYLSRVSARRRRELQAQPVLSALATLSEGRELTADEEQRLVANADALLRRARIGFVVIDGSRASAALRRHAIDALHLRLVDRDGAFELYRPDEAVP
jgi:hypothetical protein